MLPLDERAAEHVARIRFDLEKAGLQIGPLDTLIAGTVLAHGAILVTHNVAEFSKVPRLADGGLVLNHRRLEEEA